jgi:transposase
VFIKKQKAAQGEFWVAAHKLALSPKGTFYCRLDETLESFGFAEKVRALCAPAYKGGNAGRRGIDPVVYLKMIMVGFFEDLPSERAIAARCADSMSIRAFLNQQLRMLTLEARIHIIERRLKRGRDWLD